MIDNWEEILGKKFQNDSVSPPKSAWDQIQDSTWQKTLKNKVNNTQAPEIPAGLKHAVFTKTGITNGLWGLGLKTAAIIGGISITAAGLFWVNQNSQKINTVDSPSELVETVETNSRIDLNSDPDIYPQIQNSNSHNPIAKSETTPYQKSQNDKNMRIQETSSELRNASISSSEY